MKKGWVSYFNDDKSIANIVPLNDDKEHEHSNLSSCKPKLEVVNGVLIITHNSFDGREAVEWTHESLKNKD